MQDARAWAAGWATHLENYIPGIAGMISRGWKAGVKALDREAARAARP